MPELVMFGGPTLARARAIRPDLSFDGIELRPPVQRGDLPKLVREVKPPAAIAIVDGKFHQVLAVGHMEIRNAMAAGWAVWGLSSLGAIAREMHHLGMNGYGRVFELYCRPGDFRDDEVTLLHEAEPPFRELSEPLVHLRLALEGAAELGALAGEVAEQVIAELDGMYFGERTLPWLKATLLARTGDGGAYDRIAASLDRHRIKSLDLIEFVERRAWAA